MIFRIKILPLTDDEPCPIILDRFNAKSGLFCPFKGVVLCGARPSEDKLALSSSSIVILGKGKKKTNLEILEELNLSQKRNQYLVIRSNLEDINLYFLVSKNEKTK